MSTRKRAQQEKHKRGRNHQVAEEAVRPHASDPAVTSHGMEVDGASATAQEERDKFLEPRRLRPAPAVVDKH